MTLIITEINKYGIVMVADTAVTEGVRFPLGDVTRVLNGVLKLQIIPYLSAGISMWGLGNIPSSGVPTDIWIYDFIRRQNHVTSLGAFAESLTNELKAQVGDVREPMGFHLAGYMEVDGKNNPTLYHIRNVDGTYEHFDFHDFIPGFTPLQDVQLETHNFFLRNGDYAAYAHLVGAVDWVLPEIEKRRNLEIPHPSLEGRIAYHAAWVRFVSNLYNSSGLPQTIGGDIVAIGIRPDNQMIHHRY